MLLYESDKGPVTLSWFERMLNFIRELFGFNIFL